MPVRLHGIIKQKIPLPCSNTAAAIMDLGYRWVCQSLDMRWVYPHPTVARSCLAAVHLIRGGNALLIYKDFSWVFSLTKKRIPQCL